MLTDLEGLLGDAGYPVSLPNDIIDAVRSLLPEIERRRHEALVVCVQLSDIKAHNNEAKDIAEQLCMLTLFAWDRGQEEIEEMLKLSEKILESVPD